MKQERFDSTRGGSRMERKKTGRELQKMELDAVSKTLSSIYTGVFFIDLIFLVG